MSLFGSYKGVLSGAYGALPARFRKRRLQRTALDAEYDVPKGRVGQIVRQLRFRGEVAYGRARVFLGLLIVVIALRLAFYLRLPFWQQFAEGRTQALKEQLLDINARHKELNDERMALISNIQAFLDDNFGQLRDPDGKEGSSCCSFLPRSARFTATTCAWPACIIPVRTR